jgi:hypothetical protein
VPAGIVTLTLAPPPAGMVDGVVVAVRTVPVDGSSSR